MEQANSIALSLNEIVFEHRNKQYGAYQLRKAYEQYLQRATFIGVTVFAVFVAFLWYSFKYSADSVPSLVDGDITLSTIDDPPVIEIPQTPPTSPEPKRQVATVDLREMIVTSPEEATPNEALTHIDEIGEREISNATVEGETPSGDLIIDPNASTNGMGGLLGPTTTEEIFTTVEQMPEFEGGMSALAKFLSRNLRFPASSQQKGISGVVYVSFVVSSKGEVTDAKILKGIDEACDQEAIRVVEKMPNWRPGRQNGRNVSVRYSIPIRFAVSN